MVSPIKPTTLFIAYNVQTTYITKSSKFFHYLTYETVPIWKRENDISEPFSGEGRREGAGHLIR